MSDAAFKNPFDKQTYGWIQFKGTDICIDIHCECGYHSHFDGYFMYYIRCPRCKLVWEANGHIQFHKSPEVTHIEIQNPE